MTRWRKNLVAIGVFGASITAAVAVGGGAVTNASGGLNLDDTRTNISENAAGVDSGTVNQNLSVVDGNIDLVATGTNTKTLVINAVPCGNASMNWDDSPAGSAYRVTKRSTWNREGDCPGGVVGSIPFVTMWANNGVQHNYQDLDQSETIQNFYISTGTPSTKTQWVTNSAVEYCAYLIPGGGGYWAPDACSV